MANAPETPSAATTSLLHTGQPTASMLNTFATEIREPRPEPRASGRENHSAVSTEVATRTGGSHHRTGVIREKSGVLITSVGIPIARALTTPAATPRLKMRPM